MAEAIGIAASIAGLLSLGIRMGVTLNEFINSAKSAPASVCAISDELDTLTQVLAYIQDVITDDNSSKSVDAGLLSAALSGCKKSFQELESHISALRTRFQGNTVKRVWAQMSWPAKEKEIAFMARRLGEHKATLGLALQLKILEAAKTKSQLQEETKPPTRGSESADESVSSAAVLMSAATLKEVQGHSGFNSWLKEFVTTPTLEAKKANDFSQNLAKLKAAESNRESVLALEANGSGGGWAQQVVLESIQKMLGTSTSGGAVHIIVKDLVKPVWAEGQEKQVEEVLISPESTVFDLCERISSKGYYDICGFKVHGEEEGFAIAPFTQKSTVAAITVTSGPSCYDLRKGYQINCNETLIEFFNRRFDTKVNERFNLVNHGTYLTAEDTRHRVTIQFRRTLRIPDDGNTYRLPESVSNFRLFETSAFEKMPRSLQAKGGLFFPMYQREALCLVFSDPSLGFSGKSYGSSYDSQFAIKIYAGGINAVSGAVVDGEDGGEDELEQDYIVSPPQRRLGGLITGPEEAKQFVSMPLGSGYTVEQQLTGKENIGGIQLEIIPRYREDCFFGKPSVGDKNFKIDTEILKKAGLDHFLTPNELGLFPGARIYMQDLGETPYSYNFKYRDNDEAGSLENCTVVPEYRVEEERPTFVHELFIGDRTHCYDPHSSLVITPIMAIPLTIVPGVEWGSVPFNLNCSPFARISDLSHIVRQLLPRHRLRITEFEFAQGKTGPDIDTTLYQMGISGSARVYVRGASSRDIYGFGNNIDSFNTTNSFNNTASIRYEAEVEDSWDMGLAAGGRIKNIIVKDSNPRAWNKTATKMFNIQMVNSVAFEAITGLVPPMPTISFEDYAKAKIPYYIHDQANPSWICQQFDSISTVSEMDTAKVVKFVESLKPGATVVGCVCCERNICDCILDVCKHTFCYSCVKYHMVTNEKVTCGLCNTPAARIIRFSASMSLRPLGNRQSHQITGKPTSQRSLDGLPLPTAPVKSPTPQQQAKLQDLLIHAIQARDVNAVMCLLTAGADGADKKILEKSIFRHARAQHENYIFDLMLAQILADVQKAERVNWKKLMSIAVGDENEHCIKRLAPLCVSSRWTWSYIVDKVREK